MHAAALAIASTSRVDSGRMRRSPRREVDRGGVVDAATRRAEPQDQVEAMLGGRRLGQSRRNCAIATSVAPCAMATAAAADNVAAATGRLPARPPSRAAPPVRRRVLGREHRRRPPVPADRSPGSRLPYTAARDERWTNASGTFGPRISARRSPSAISPASSTVEPAVVATCRRCASWPRTATALATSAARSSSRPSRASTDVSTPSSVAGEGDPVEPVGIGRGPPGRSRRRGTGCPGWHWPRHCRTLGGGLVERLPHELADRRRGSVVRGRMRFTPSVLDSRASSSPTGRQADRCRR